MHTRARAHAHAHAQPVHNLECQAGCSKMITLEMKRLFAREVGYEVERASTYPKDLLEFWLPEGSVASGTSSGGGKKPKAANGRTLAAEAAFEGTAAAVVADATPGHLDGATAPPKTAGSRPNGNKNKKRPADEGGRNSSSSKNKRSRLVDTAAAVAPGGSARSSGARPRPGSKVPPAIGTMGEEDTGGGGGGAADEQPEPEPEPEDAKDAALLKTILLDELHELAPSVEAAFKRTELTDDEQTKYEELLEMSSERSKSPAAAYDWMSKFTDAQLRDALNQGWFTEEQADLAAKRLEKSDAASSRTRKGKNKGKSKSTLQQNPQRLQQLPCDTLANDERFAFDELVQRTEERAELAATYKAFYAKIAEHDPDHLSRIQSIDREGKTPLHHRVVHCEQYEVEKLILQGAKVQTVDNAGWTPLHDAGNFAIAKMLLEAGADPSYVSGKHGSSPLHEAAHYTNIEVMQLMLQHGADVTVRNHYGENAARVSKDPEVLAILSEAAKVHATTFDNPPNTA